MKSSCDTLLELVFGVGACDTKVYSLTRSTQPGSHKAFKYLIPIIPDSFPLPVFYNKHNTLHRPPITREQRLMLLLHNIHGTAYESKGFEKHQRRPPSGQVAHRANPTGFCTPHFRSFLSCPLHLKRQPLIFLSWSWCLHKYWWSFQNVKHRMLMPKEWYLNDLICSH